MKALIYFLINGSWPCQHQWETVSNTLLYKRPIMFIEESDKMSVGKSFILRCTKCGEVKGKTIYY